VAALGHAHGPNAERGVYRSRDGGMTWEQVLTRGEKAGAIDLSIDPTNPRVLYASFWEAVRGPHFLASGGEGSGLFRSADGGDTWTDISRNKGLPQGLLGKIGVAASGAQAGRVYAVVEAQDGAVFRSDDWGETWQRLSEERNLRQRAWYYHHIHADPQDPDTVWVLNVQAWKSIDGGKTFAEVAIPHGDNHDLWIDPHNPQRMIEGNDGGACVSFNGGHTWSTIYNQPTAEFYHVTTDSRTPYRVYGAQQDNTTMSIPSRSNLAAITMTDYWEVGGGESGYIAVRPDNPNIIFAGNYQGYITRYDQSTGQARNVMVWPEALSGLAAKDARYRFQWTYPILLSPHDPNVLYATGNHVFRSTDEGSSWKVVSPDLTRNDPSTHDVSGGPITKDSTGAEYYGTIFAFAESPLERGTFWAGSDDGLVHVSRDGGASWEDVTPNSLPKWALISIVEPSPHDPATAYLAATAYKLDDFRPYLLKTSDYGKTWTAIATGIEANDFTRAIREDPVRRGLLYAGTETGVYVSYDDGARWQRLKLNLPVVPIHDMVVKDSDLVVATHGRSFWILDDLTPLREVQASMAAESAHLYRPRDTIRFLFEGGFARESTPISYNFTGPIMVTSRRIEKPTGETSARHLDAGLNPPDGVVVTYYLKEKPAGEITLAFLDAEGNEIKFFKSEEKKEATTAETDSTTPPTELEAKAKEEKKEPRAPKEAGANRFVWNMRYPDPRKVEGYVSSEGAMSGPLAAPGDYQVRLTVGEQSYTQPFRILKDPRVPATDDDLREQFAFLLRVRDKLNEVQDAINTLRNARGQVDEWLRRAKDGEHHERVEQAGKELREKLTAIEGELIQAKAKSRQDTLNFGVRLNARLAFLSGVAASADARPTRQTYELFEKLAAQADEVLGRLRQVLDTDVAAFNTLIRELSLPAIVPTAVEPKGE
jgi:photosystem II stability/assembly factor-like uncharacterized protein